VWTSEPGEQFGRLPVMPYQITWKAQVCLSSQLRQLRKLSAASGKIRLMNLLKYRLHNSYFMIA